MAQKQSTSPWVWVLLMLLLASFVAFILFLDQKIIKTASDDKLAQPSGASETKPTIDFYTVLPDREIEFSVSEDDLEGIENPTINKDVEQNFVLQVGSFQSAGEADGLKAQLAFLGLQATVKAAVVNDETWHRVQLGPFTSNSKLSRAKNLLIENEIKYMQRSLN